MQETFCKLFEQSAIPNQLGGWLFRVALNVARESHRKDRRRVAREQTTFRKVYHRDLPSQRIEQQDQQQAIQNAVMKLELEYREIVIARLWGDLTWPEVSILLQKPQTTLHRKFHEALELLRNELQSESKEPIPCNKRI